jgi:AcrR family transcriptional regulator
MKASNRRPLASAADLYLQEGYPGASMDAIAARARVSKRTLYCRYGDKAALFEAVLYEMLTRVSPTDPQRFEAAAGLQAALRLIIRNLIGTISNPEFLRCIG